MKQVLLAGVLLMVGLSVTFWYLTFPTVYMSHATGECYSVHDPAGVYSCENMPEKFIHEWVR